MTCPVFASVHSEHAPPDELNHLVLVERERIARQLHDNMAQDLAFINNQAAAVRILLSKGQIEKAQRQIELLEEVTRDLAGDIRALIGDLQPSNQVAGSLDRALYELTVRFSRINRLPVYYEVGSELLGVDFSPQINAEIYYIVQEALTNIRKHAHASAAWVNLVQGETCVDVVIRDDGRGFKHQPWPTNLDEHFGLPIMQARAQTIGARINIESHAGEGTQLVLCIPYQPERQPCVS